MDSLESLRAQIDAVDEKMKELFLSRMELIEKVHAVKSESGKGVEDSGRETEMLQKASLELLDSPLCDYYLDFLRSEMEISKRYQRDLGDHGGILIESGSLKNLSRYVNLDRKVFLLTDSGIPGFYVDTVLSQCRDAFLYTLPQGEENKNSENYLAILKSLSENGFTRKDLLIALGGGVVTDMGGFVSSTFLRGIDCCLIPTTILAQVDASVGGKNGINLGKDKNRAGTIRNPQFVLIDPSLTKTLDERQKANGLAEAVKTGLILDEKIIELFENGSPEENLETIVSLCVAAKREVVLKDPFEKNIRRCLNFGHTLGHGIESLGNFKTVLHGEAVAMGMVPMCAPDVKKRLLSILKSLHLEPYWDGDYEELLKVISRDKKCEDDYIYEVFCPKVGSYEIRKTKPEDIVNLLRREEKP